MKKDMEDSVKRKYIFVHKYTYNTNIKYMYVF